MLIISFTNLFIIIFVVFLLEPWIELFNLVHLRIRPWMLIKQRFAVVYLFKSLLLLIIVDWIRSVMGIATLRKAIVILSLLRTWIILNDLIVSTTRHFPINISSIIFIINLLPSVRVFSLVYFSPCLKSILKLIEIICLRVVNWTRIIWFWK